MLELRAQMLPVTSLDAAVLSNLLFPPMALFPGSTELFFNDEADADDETDEERTDGDPETESESEIRKQKEQEK